MEPFAIIGRGPSGKKVEYSLLNLDNDECRATGGKEYRNTNMKDIVLIHKGQPFVRFWFRKGNEHKKVDQRFDPPPAADCRLSFDITMVPSQGFAKVEIIPDVPDVFKGRRLLLDWDRMTSNAKHRIPGRVAVPGQGSNPFANPGQNVGFSDGFLTKSPVDVCHSGQPGETTDPQTPMKSKDDPQSKGLPPVPPSC